MGRREGGREGGRVGGWEGGRDGGRQAGRQGGREGGRRKGESSESWIDHYSELLSASTDVNTSTMYMYICVTCNE